MKRLFYFIALFSACFYFISCNKYSSYTEACYAGDFLEARKMLDAQKADLENYRTNHELITVKKRIFSNHRDFTNKQKYEAMINDYMNAVQFINMEEIRYVISQGLDGLPNKINYLLNEFDVQISDIQKKIALDFGNFGDLYENSERIMPEAYETIIKLAIDGDNCDLIVSMMNYYGEDIIPTNALTHLAKKNSEEVSLAILNYMSEVKPKDTPLQPGVVYNSTYVDGIHERWLNQYNQLCMSILDVAIINANQFLAERIVNLAKQTYKWTEKGDKKTFIYINDDKKMMKKKYDDAVAKGAFKNH